MLALIIIALAICGLLAVFNFMGCVMGGDKEDFLVFGPNLLGHIFAIIVLALVLAGSNF